MKYPKIGCSNRFCIAEITVGTVGKLMSAIHIGITSKPFFGLSGDFPGINPSPSTASASIPRLSYSVVKSNFIRKTSLNLPTIIHRPPPPLNALRELRKTISHDKCASQNRLKNEVSLGLYSMNNREVQPM